MGHTANNQSYKAHRNGIHRPRIALKKSNLKKISLKGDDPKFLRNLRYVRKKYIMMRRTAKRKSRHLRNNARRAGEKRWFNLRWRKSMDPKFVKKNEPKPYKKPSKELLEERKKNVSRKKLLQGRPKRRVKKEYIAKLKAEGMYTEPMR